MKYEILTVKQFQIAYPGIYKRCFSYNSIRHPFCKAEVTGDALAGTFAVPKKPEVSLEKQIFGYCITEGRLLFIDDTDYVSTLLAALETAEPHASDSPIFLLYDLMEYMIKDDMLFLQSYEDELEDLEDIITGEKKIAMWILKRQSLQYEKIFRRSACTMTGFPTQATRFSSGRRSST